MSYQPQPPVGPLNGNAAAAAQESDQLRELVALLHQGDAGGVPLERRAEALHVEAIIRQLPPQPPPQYGEVPGEGYLYAHTPTARQATLVHTDPDTVRNALLRAVEVAAQNALLPFSENKPGDWGKAALEFAQAYLLLDPEVDAEGIPVGAAQAATGDAQERAAIAAGAAQAHVAQATAEAAGTAKFTHPVTMLGHPEPPRVAPNPAENAVAEKNKPKSEVLRGARADRPRPQPRVGGE